MIFGDKIKGWGDKDLQKYPKAFDITYQFTGTTTSTTFRIFR